MISKTAYKDLDHTLKGLRTQILDSLNYCQDQNWYFDNPREMYYYLTPLLRYKNDPQNVELIQSVPTLLEDNWHGVPGAGDCDCFTVLACAVGCVNNWKQRIVLCGRSKNGPVHIFSQVYWNGKWHTVDFTARLFDVHKKYKFYQYLPI
jgi:hypothetical protein